MTDNELQAVMRAVAIAMKEHIGVIAGELEARLEARIQAVELTHVGLATLGMIGRLDKTLNSPVTPVYDAQGKLVAAQRMAPGTPSLSNSVLGEVKAHILDELAGRMEARMAVIEKRAAALRYCGVWKDGALYDQHNFVTLGGSIWHANCTTDTRPGVDQTWTLAVKEGHRGKDAPR